VTAGRDTDFTEFAEAAVPGLRRLAYLLCHDWHSADDLVQATITRLFTRWSTAADADNLEAYVRTMLLREFLHERRTSWSRRVDLTGEPPVTIAPAPDTETALDVAAAIRAQPGLTPLEDQRDPTKNTAVFSEFPAATAPAVCQAHGRAPSAMVNGYRVYVTRLAYSQGVCAPDIDDLQVGVWVSGGRPFASATAVLAQLRFFGPDPANWPATPFG
jgi:Sigma-70 region 2